MNSFGIKFAPLYVPMERRLQTLAAGAWFITIAFGSLISMITATYILLYTRYSWLILLYYLWILYDRDIGNKGGRKCNWVRDWIWWKYFCKYFPLSIVKTADLPPDQNYLFAVFPHGMLCSGIFGNFATNASDVKNVFPGITPFVLTLDMHFITPFFRELSLSLGTCSASKKSIMYLLDEDQSKGKAVVLMVGGAQESLYCRPGTYKIILKGRKGFIKLAIQTGTSIVPVFSFGETDLYDQVDNPPGSWLLWLQNWIRKVIGIAPCIPIGRGLFQYNFGFVPRRHPVTTVVGNPITVVKNKNPTDEEVETLHSLFVTKLTELFEQYKHKYLSNPDNTSLVIV